MYELEEEEEGGEKDAWRLGCGEAGEAGDAEVGARWRTRLAFRLEAMCVFDACSEYDE